MLLVDLPPQMDLDYDELANGCIFFNVEDFHNLWLRVQASFECNYGVNMCQWYVNGVSFQRF